MRFRFRLRLFLFFDAVVARRFERFDFVVGEYVDESRRDAFIVWHVVYIMFLPSDVTTVTCPTLRLSCARIMFATSFAGISLPSTVNTPSSYASGVSGILR